jgi:asparaginyl-tRNA synthetase
MKRLFIKTFFEESIQSQIGQKIIVKGWVRSKRESKNVNFLAVNDGTIIHSVQIVVDNNALSPDTMKQITTGACVEVHGTLVESPAQGQFVEIHAENIIILGSCPSDTYPLQKKGHTLEFLREIGHLRPRTNTFGAVLRIRHHLAYAIHTFFHDKGFFYLHSPIITGSDAEGAGAMFRVTTLDPKNPPLSEDGSVNYAEDFFGKETNLTVSGQLEAELGALALSHVYTFGPTFRAENSNTPRHLAEFWMIEPEMAFYEIKENMDLAEEFLKFTVNYALTHCIHDLEFLQKMYNKELIHSLQQIVDTPFERLSYSKGIEILKACGKTFEFPVEWGCDLQSEHERYLVEQHFKKPVILTDYPKEIKAFYMKLNDDNATVRAMDVLFPRIGEIIGGSQREENYDRLLQRVRECDIPEKDVWWYLETRLFGSAPHAGFGLGFERLVLFVTGLSNIRDVIPFPRTPKNAEF